MSSRTSTSMGALRFEPILKDKVWGREAWEISDHEKDVSRVAAGSFEGETLRSLLERFPDEILGPGTSDPAFPLLFKTLSARETLSVQLHPTDADCERLAPGRRGKTEAWAILDAEPGAKIVHGIADGVTRQEFVQRVADPKADPAELEALFAWREVRRGDVVFLPAGTIHAIGGGIELVEVQQSSDITYRLYDWGRPRELHLAEAAQVSEPSEPPPEVYPSWLPEPGNGAAPSRRRMVESRHFGMEALSAPRGEELRLALDGRFGVVIGLDGSATLECPRDGESALEAGDFVLLPASGGTAALRGGEGGFSGLWVQG